MSTDSSKAGAFPKRHIAVEKLRFDAHVPLVRSASMLTFRSTLHHSGKAPDARAAEQNNKNAISWNPWVAVVFVIVVYYFSQFFASLAVSLYPALQHWNQTQANDWIQQSIWGQFAYVAIAETLTVAALYQFLRWRKVSWRAIGWRRPKWSDPAWALAVVPLYYLSYLVVVAVIHALSPSLDINQAQQIGFSGAHGFGNLLVIFISLVILPPFVEELIVRGFLYTSLKKGMPQLAAVIVTSLIFASAHLQAGSGAPLLWIAFIDTFILSLFLIYLREKTDGLWANMTLHATKNGLAFVSLFILHLK